jgi:hypothetical protein
MTVTEPHLCRACLQWYRLLEMPARAGYVTKTQRSGGANVRIEVVTDGVLLRRLQANRALLGVAAVLVDEFHERGMLVRPRLSLVLDFLACGTCSHHTCRYLVD